MTTLKNLNKLEKIIYKKQIKKTDIEKIASNIIIGLLPTTKLLSKYKKIIIKEFVDIAKKRLDKNNLKLMKVIELKTKSKDIIKKLKIKNISEQLKKEIVFTLNIFIRAFNQIIKSHIKIQKKYKKKYKKEEEIRNHY
jgi:hypothetical protein